MIYFLLTFILIFHTFADMGSPGKKAWVTITFAKKTQKEAVMFVQHGHYDPKEKQINLILFNKSSKQQVIPLQTQLTEQKIKLNWNELSDAKLVMPQYDMDLPFKVYYKNEASCSGENSEVLNLRNVAELHFHYQVSPQKKLELQKAYSLQENLKGCQTASCFVGGDYDCQAAFIPGKENPEKIKNAIEVYYNLIVSGERQEDLNLITNKIKDTPPEFKPVADLMQKSLTLSNEEYAAGQLFQNNPKCSALNECTLEKKAYGAIGGQRFKISKDIENLIKPFFDKWKVKATVTSGHSESEEWL